MAPAPQPAAGDQLIGLLLRAYGLTSRERDICREVIAGHSTTDIAGRRFISAHTVQDHLEVNVRQGRRPPPWRARGSAATRWFLRR
ncbi:MAG: LuxR C-terminal-related transcriptional regulator [Pseudonocardia sp.]|nr:LuxR C-terminal-related transcriptional regulator [Pseudonocardia sp.]